MAIGRLVRVAPGTAEIAFETDRIQATVLPSNDRSLRLLRAIGMAFRVDDGLLEGTAPVRLRETPVVDRAAVVRLALSTQATSGCMADSA